MGQARRGGAEGGSIASPRGGVQEGCLTAGTTCPAIGWTTALLKRTASPANAAGVPWRNTMGGGHSAHTEAQGDQWPVLID